jgi:hypothetical protein
VLVISTRFAIRHLQMYAAPCVLEMRKAENGRMRRPYYLSVRDAAAPAGASERVFSPSPFGATGRAFFPRTGYIEKN